MEQQTERALDVRLDGRTEASRAPGCHPPQECPSTKNLLPVRHNSQNRSFTCGNTTGLMIARYDGPKRSRYNHARLREKTMGGRAHMRTYVHHVTPWASKNFKRGLNRWMKGRSRGYYQQHKSPSPRRVRKAMRYSIDHGHPFAASTLELATRDHYNGHPEGADIGHWLVVRGYDKNLRKINSLDPAADSDALPAYSEANKRFERRTKRFTRKFLQSHGIAA
ncbi:C39 family peptidase [Nocardioidaceae bacterium SCSIO 66511]|nr:C39 family peptidase [Nocardioidaceae bacterium SCSIO 66511]